MKPGRSRMSSRLAIALLVLAAIATVSMWPFLARIDMTALLDWLRSAGMWTVPVLVGLMIAHNFVPVPGEVIAVCAGAILGTIAGTAVIWIGAMLGAALAFWISRRFGRALVEDRLDPRHLERLDRIMERQGTAGLVSVRLTPLVAFNVVNYGAGLTNVSWFTFLWTTAIGIVPITALSVYAGAHMVELSPAMLLGLTAAAVGIFLVLRFARRPGPGR